MDFADKRKTLDLQTDRMIESVKSAAPDVDIHYFCELWEKPLQVDGENKKPFIAVMDASVPELYLRACGAIPVFMFSGHYYTDPAADALFPPISDPVLKSAVSMLMAKVWVFERPVSAIAVSENRTDQIKAVGFLKEEGYRILTLNSSDFLHGSAEIRYRDSHLAFLRELENYTGNAITAGNLLGEAECITDAYEAIQQLRMTDFPQILKGFVEQSYYLATDRKQWRREVNRLAGKRGIRTETKKEAKMTLIGSPVYFPNMKIPGIMHELGREDYLDFSYGAGPLDYSAVLYRNRNSLPEILEQIHKVHYQNDRKRFWDSIHPDRISGTEGIVCHLLKGQLSYAYRAEEAEREALKKGIPFISIETDYTDADWEQLRIRLEGFNELLLSKKRSGEKGDGT